MSKYIISNCKALISNNICELYSQKGIHLSSYCYCKDKNCLLKQIVDILRENTCKPEECGMNKPDWNGEVYGCNAGFDDNVSGCSCALANNLLKLLDIQEVE